MIILILLVGLCLVAWLNPVWLKRQEIGHVKGQAAALHSIALAHMGKVGATWAVLFFGGEALKSPRFKWSREVGPKMLPLTRS